MPIPCRAGPEPAEGSNPEWTPVVQDILRAWCGDCRRDYCWDGRADRNRQALCHGQAVRREPLTGRWRINHGPRHLFQTVDQRQLLPDRAGLLHQGELRAGCGARQAQTQDGGRGLLCRPGRTAEKYRTRSRAGRALQAQQLREAPAPGAFPGEQGGAGSRAQNLLAGPDRVAVAGGAHHQQLVPGDAQLLQSLRMGLVGWLHQKQLPALVYQPSQSRRQQCQLAVAGYPEQFGQRAAGPAMPVQQGIQMRVAGGDAGRPGWSIDGAAQMRMLRQKGGKGGEGLVHG